VFFFSPPTNFVVFERRKMANLCQNVFFLVEIQLKNSYLGEIFDQFFFFSPSRNSSKISFLGEFFFSNFELKKMQKK
jgi:hypothetical protein